MLVSFTRRRRRMAATGERREASMADFVGRGGRPDGAPGLILNVAVLGEGMHVGAWRYRAGAASDFTDIGFYQEIGRQA